MLFSHLHGFLARAHACNLLLRWRRGTLHNRPGSTLATLAPCSQSGMNLHGTLSRRLTPVRAEKLHGDVPHLPSLSLFLSLSLSLSLSVSLFSLILEPPTSVR